MDDDMPTGARAMPPPRTHETRRVESPPLDEEDDPATPQEIIDVPPQLARQARPTPLGIRARHPNAPRMVNTQAPTSRSADVLAQANAPAAELDEADTRQRTRKAPAAARARRRRRCSRSPAPSFLDDARSRRCRRARRTPPQQPRPPSQKVQPLARTPPPSSSAAATVQLPPGEPDEPARRRAQAVAAPVVRGADAHPARRSRRRSTPAASSPASSDPDANSALSSLPLGEPGAELRKPSRAGVYVALAILGLVVVGAVAAISVRRLDAATAAAPSASCRSRRAPRCASTASAARSRRR